MWILLGQASAATMSFVTVFVSTRYLGPDQYGMFSTAMSLAILLIPLADLGFDLHMTRAISANQDSLRPELSHTLSARILLAAMVWFLMISCAILLRYQTRLVGYVALLGLSTVIASVAQSLIGAIRAIRKMKYESMALSIGRLATMTAVVTIVLLRGQLLEIILAYILGSTALILAALFFLKSQIGGIDFHFGLDGISERFRSALPFGLTMIFSTVYFKIDTIIISKFYDAAQVGFYNGAQNIIGASMMLATPVVVAMFPALAAVYPAEKEEAQYIFQRGLGFMILLSLPLGIGTVLMAESIIRLAYGIRFLPTVPLLTIMGAKIPIVFTTLLIGTSLGAIGFQRKVALVSGINMLFNVVMNLLFIPVYGARAAALIAVLTELLGLVQLAFAMRSILSVKIARHLLKAVLCCTIGTFGFLMVEGLLGSWPAALVFSLAYAGAIFSMKLVSVALIKDLLFFKNAP
jgi:O-antigen/teichoic acid export membrane protein